MNELSHIDQHGKASMVDVGSKPAQQRVAKASGFIALSAETIRLIRENQMKKGDVLTVAEIAGIQAAKQTPTLIPLCHNLLISVVKVRCTLTNEGVVAQSEVACTANTGVEMEALTGVSIALLTVYDMCKAVDKSMVISEIKLDSKTKT